MTYKDRMEPMKGNQPNKNNVIRIKIIKVCKNRDEQKMEGQ